MMIQRADLGGIMVFHKIQIQLEEILRERFASNSCPARSEPGFPGFPSRKMISTLIQCTAIITVYLSKSGCEGRFHIQPGEVYMDDEMNWKGSRVCEQHALLGSDFRCLLFGAGSVVASTGSQRSGRITGGQRAASERSQGRLGASLWRPGHSSMFHVISQSFRGPYRSLFPFRPNENHTRGPLSVTGLGSSHSILSRVVRLRSVLPLVTGELLKARFRNHFRFSNPACVIISRNPFPVRLRPVTWPSFQPWRVSTGASRPAPGRPS